MTTADTDYKAYLELMLERIKLIHWILLLHLSDGNSQIGGRDLSVSTSDRLQDGIVDER